MPKIRLLNPTNGFLAQQPSKTPSTPTEEYQLTHTLSEIHHLLDRIVENRSWKSSIQEPCFELQKLAANTHMAISSQEHDCHQVWRELGQLEYSAKVLIPKFYDPDRDIHPRVLTILLRLIVDGSSKPFWERKTLELVRGLFSAASWLSLGSNYPITLLLKIPTEKANELLWRQVSLLNTRFYTRAKDFDPTFVACERIYCAQVLASLGYPVESEAELHSVIDTLGPRGDQYALADAHRTLGYSKFQSTLTDEASAQAAEGESKVSEAQWKFVDAQCKFIDARLESSRALEIFEQIDRGNTENAMYTRICLAWTFHHPGDLVHCEIHLRAALGIWKSNNPNNPGQGAGVKQVLDLDQVLCKQGKTAASERLRAEYAQYFEKSPGAE